MGLDRDRAGHSQSGGTHPRDFVPLATYKCLLTHSLPYLLHTFWLFHSSVQVCHCTTGVSSRDYCHLLPLGLSLETSFVQGVSAWVLVTLLLWAPYTLSRQAQTRCSNPGDVCARFLSPWLLQCLLPAYSPEWERRGYSRRSPEALANAWKLAWFRGWLFVGIQGGF